MSRYLVPAFALVGVSTVAFVLIFVVVAQSPYTHANLSDEPPTDYTRTSLGFLGQEEPFLGLGLGDSPLAESDTPVDRGLRLFIRAGCASCHGLRGEGGIIGPSIAGSSESKIGNNVRSGPKGMPVYSPEELSDDDVADIATFLRSAKEERAGQSSDDEAGP